MRQDMRNKKKMRKIKEKCECIGKIGKIVMCASEKFINGLSDHEICCRCFFTCVCVFVSRYD